MNLPRAAAVAALVVALAGCGGPDNSGTAAPSPSPEGGPLRCVVADPDGELILHPGSLTAPAAGVTLDGVDLEGATNLEVIETDTVPFSGTSTVRGVILDYPPMKNAGLADSLADWDQRKPLEGRHLTKADEQQAVLVALRLSDGSETGRIAGVRLRTDDPDLSKTYPEPLLIKPHGEPCTVDDYASAKASTPAGPAY